MKKTALFSAIALTLSGCLIPEYTTQTAMNLRSGVGPGSLCEEIINARSMGTAESLNALIEEYQRRNPNVSSRDLSDLRQGLVRTGMREEVAICSWNARLVGETIGYGQHSKQYHNSGYSFFFVNGRTGRVDYIAS